MIFLFLVCSQVWLMLADCPLSNYPRDTHYGVLHGQIENHDGDEYRYPYETAFSSSNVNVAIGVMGFNLQIKNQFSYSIDYVPVSNPTTLKFKVTLNNKVNWVQIKFNFLASSSELFQMQKHYVDSFSVGLEQGMYGVYKPIKNFQDYSMNPVIRVMVDGISMEGKSPDEDYTRMEKQYRNFKRFSTNSRLIKYFEEAIVQKTSLKFSIENIKITSVLLSFSVKTNSNLHYISFTSILFSGTAYNLKHNEIHGDFSIVYSQSHQISRLNHMDMTLVGLVGFSIPANSQYSFQIILNNFFSQSSFEVETSHNFCQVSFTYLALEIKQQFICQDCQNSPFVFQKFCVSSCPRGYSQVKRFNNTYCQRCSINDLKIVDPSTHQCVCARRHFLNPRDNACTPCPYDCMTCTSTQECDSCDNNQLQTKRTMNSSRRCSCPILNYYDDKANENIVCQKCHITCRTCYGGRFHDCLSCQRERELDSFGHCVCRNNYQSTTDGKCICKPPYKIINGECIDLNEICQGNKHQTIINGVRRCVCKSGYISIANECIQCQDNQIFDQDSLSCKCVNRTILVDGRCVPCGVNQIYHEGRQRCVCRPNTFQTKQMKCVSCPPKMVYTDDQCQCIFNYFLNKEGKCEKCLRESDGPKCRRIVI